jgi:proton glutamate symport protein
MARTSCNVLGNCLATVVMAKWEGDFDKSFTSANPVVAAVAGQPLTVPESRTPV